MSAPDERLPACRRLLFPLLHECNKGNRRRLGAGKMSVYFVVVISASGGGELRWETCLGAAVIKDAVEQALAYTRLFSTLF